MELLAIIAAIFIIGSLLYKADLERLTDDYEDWKNGRR
jgi:hypothetical protein